MSHGMFIVMLSGVDSGTLLKKLSANNGHARTTYWLRIEG
jgi:hypothetical protein